MKIPRRWLRASLALGATGLLGALLAATVVWTHFDPHWITFLGGILFAAVLATASQVSRAEWRMARRDRQITRLRQRLEEETARRRTAEAALDAYELGQRQAPAPAEVPGEEAPAAWGDPKARLERALAEDEFILFGQAIAPLAGGEPLCEVLLRLREEEDNFLPPGGFFPVAERYGMMERLDRWVVSHVMALAPRDAVHCVNLSSAALASAEFAQFVQQRSRELRFDLRALCLEIAEADLIAHNAAARSLVAALRPLGCRFTADAFGSVKGSFAPLAGVAVDFVKIDGVIVQNLAKPAEAARAKSIIGMCGKLGIRTIGEFVEDEAMRERLRALGVDYVQGFGVARPAPLRPAFRSRPGVQ